MRRPNVLQGVGEGTPQDRQSRGLPSPELGPAEPTPIVAQARSARGGPSARLSAWYFIYVFLTKPPKRS